jgi:hypothetical protein
MVTANMPPTMGPAKILPFTTCVALLLVSAAAPELVSKEEPLAGAEMLSEAVIVLETGELEMAVVELLLRRSLDTELTISDYENPKFSTSHSKVAKLNIKYVSLS